MKTRLLTFILILLSPYSSAQDDYKCTILDGAEVRGDGVLTSLGAGKLKDEEFVVQRSSGKIIGALENEGAGQPEVIDIGGDENSYKAVTVVNVYNEKLHRMVGGITYLQINDYLEGEAVPFYFFDSILGLLTGICSKY